MKKKILVALTLFLVAPTTKADVHPFWIWAPIVIGGVFYYYTPYTCPECNEYIKENEPYEAKKGCSHRYHPNHVNIHPFCQRCKKENMIQQKTNAYTHKKHDENIREDEREKIKIQEVKAKEKQQFQQYLTQKEQAKIQHQQQAEKIPQQQSAFTAMQQQQRENQKLFFEREQAFIKTVDWMMEPCMLCSRPLAQKDISTDSLVDLRKNPKHYSTLSCSTGDGKHRFHRLCLKKWGTLHTVCPICGSEFTSDQL